MTKLLYKKAPQLAKLYYDSRPQYTFPKNTVPLRNDKKIQERGKEIFQRKEQNN